MRKADLAKNHVGYDAAITRYREFMRRILQNNQVVANDMEKRDIAESVLLRLCAYWEWFVDEQLADCINVDHSKLSQYFGVSLPNNPSKGLCEALLIGGRYLDFRSFGDLKGHSKKILPDKSNPFLAITKNRAKRLDEAYLIRNYLAHYSSLAKRSLHEMYRREYQMTNFIEPGQFLLAYGARRLNVYFDAFEGASTDMKNWYPSK